jgi:hypothetical protein
MDVSEAKRLKQLEDENAKLKKLLAKQMLDAAALRELLSKKWQGPPSSAKASRIFGPRWACRNGGPARSSALTARWSVTAPVGRQTRSFGRNCAVSPTRGSVSDIVGCSSCWGRRASPRASTASTGFIAKKASRCTSGGLGGAPWGRGRRSWSNPSRTLAGRWISSMTSLPAAGGSAS